MSGALHDRLTELDRQITESETGQEPWTSRAGEAPDAGDASVADHLQTKERSLEQQAVDQRNRVIDALQRLKTGDYGECVDCGTEILVDRLQAQPEVERCLRCQQAFEANHASAGAGSSL
ncbi:TraR/DksA family transcriptional regulator [uncultured Abyssibacter sp.]|uniref:TraR/DksA family transcriptional regulator n=1 Tax=uncultured Abyssibacter sp. TaxID=2320202 RepID=UPI0032B25038